MAIKFFALQFCYNTVRIGNNFFCCIMYADDLLLMSASVSGLQAMLDICHAYSQSHAMIFNSKKSSCCQFGDRNFIISNMMLGDLEIVWVTSFKYLGVTFISGPKFTIDFQIIKRKFYCAVNSVLSHCKRNDNLVKLKLVKSFCLPLLTYCLGAFEASQSKIKDLAVCWNDCFRKIFGFHRWESVRELQCFLGDLPFEFIYDIHRWRFLTNRKCVYNSLSFLLDISNLQYHYVDQLVNKYGQSGRFTIADRVKCWFQQSFTQYLI